MKFTIKIFKERRITLKERLLEVIYDSMSSPAELAKQLGITYQSLNNKLNGRSDFTRKEMQKIIDIYDLSSEETYIIFFSD